MNASSQHDESNVARLHTGRRAVDAQFDRLMVRFEELSERQLDVLYDEAEQAQAQAVRDVSAPAVSPARARRAAPRLARASGAPGLELIGAVLLADRTARTAIPSSPGDSGTQSSDEPWQLVKSAQEGNSEAFGVLYDKYADMVFRYVLFRVGGDRSLAEDVTSETFLTALRSIGSVSYQGRDVGAWFVTIARNIVFDHVKSNRFRLEVTAAELHEARETEADPEREVMTEAVHAELLRGIDQLNTEQRQCITLRFIEGMSIAETAELMNRNESAVKALQHRAVRRLAQILPDWLR